LPILLVLAHRGDQPVGIEPRRIGREAQSFEQLRREVLDTAGASYVALAEALDCAVVTADAKLSAITAARCPVLRVAN